MDMRGKVEGLIPDKAKILFVAKERAPQLVKEHAKRLAVVPWKNYVPLIVVISLIFVVSFVLALNSYQTGGFSLLHAIGYFMIGFFIVFSGFKLMDLEGFAEGFATYDLLARKIFAYGYLYPFIELAFGLAMLAEMQNRTLFLGEALVMGFSGMGVLRKFRRNEPVQCLCLGTFLKVPLTHVTLVENFGMAALALILFLFQG